MKKISFIVFICFIALTGNSQEAELSKLAFNGYLTLMPQYQWSKGVLGMPDTYLSQNLVHNRINFHYYATDNISLSAQFRNRFMSGDSILLGNFTDGFKSDMYYLPLSYYEKMGSNGVLAITIDRLYLNYVKDKLEIKIGRQRINWGQTFAWNPNDIFNSYSYFDFDYVERPGADAVRIQYYTGLTSQLDFAAKIDENDNITAAGLFRFNVHNIDMQILAGYYNTGEADYLKEKDFVGGFSFTTDFKGLSIRSETSYFHPEKSSANQQELIMSSLGFDYTFSNDLYLISEFLFLSKVNMSLTGGLSDLYTSNLNVKNLSFAKYNGMVQLSYPLTDLMNTSLSAMVFSDNNLAGFYTGPSIDYSIAQNVDLSFIAQYFQFEIEETLPVIGNQTISFKTLMGFLRMKWSF